MAISNAVEFKKWITQLQIVETAAEFHGFLSGLIAGNVCDESWKPLTYQICNDGHAFSQTQLQQLSEFYQLLQIQFAQNHLLFSLWQVENDGFALADSIAEWTSYFLLGLGLAQPKLEQENDEIKEAIEDLAEITKLGYDSEDSSEALLEAGAEIVEYLRIVALFLHHHFSIQPLPSKQLH